MKHLNKQLIQSWSYLYVVTAFLFDIQRLGHLGYHIISALVDSVDKRVIMKILKVKYCQLYFPTQFHPGDEMDIVR